MRILLLVLILIINSHSLASASIIVESTGFPLSVNSSDAANDNVIVESYSNLPYLTLSGSLLEGSSGTIQFDQRIQGGYEFGIYGVLPPTSMVTFTYNSLGFRDDYADAFVNAGSAVGGTNLIYSRNSVYGDMYKTKETHDYASISPLYFADVEAFEDNANKITTTIINNSTGSTSFRSAFVQLALDDLFPSVLVSYDVSAVPVPAALPMFGFGIASLMGVGIRRKYKS